jgi:8-oxo-dGTP diphosphatase
VSEQRAAVVLRDDSRVLLIRQRRDGHTYFGFPGAGMRAGEAPADAAVREARDELGVNVVLGPRLLVEEFRGQTVHYFSGLIVGGELGTGTVEPEWFEVEDLPDYDVRPRALAAILTGG